MACLIVSRQYTLAESGQLQTCNSLLSSEKQYASPSPLGDRVTDDNLLTSAFLLGLVDSIREIALTEDSLLPGLHIGHGIGQELQ